MRILVISYNADPTASYTHHWLAALRANQTLSIEHLNLRFPIAAARASRALKRVDAVVVLHTALADSIFRFRSVLPILQTRSVPLVVFIGNEYNSFLAPLEEKIECLRELEPEVIATQLLNEAGIFLYSSINSSRVVSIPHGVFEGDLPLYQAPPSPPVLVGTRTAAYSPFLGDSDRLRLVAALQDDADTQFWKVDLGFGRMKSDQWLQFLASLHATAGTEAGSRYTRPTEDLIRRVLERVAPNQVQTMSNIRDMRLQRLGSMFPQRARAFVMRNIRQLSPGSTLATLSSLKPEEVLEAFEYESPAPAYTKAISSRHMEAAGIGVPQLLVEGRYNDILKPWLHYVPVKRDMSDLTEALEALKDPAVRSEISANARELVLGAHTLRHRVDQVICEIEASS